MNYENYNFSIHLIPNKKHYHIHGLSLHIYGRIAVRGFLVIQFLYYVTYFSLVLP